MLGLGGGSVAAPCVGAGLLGVFARLGVGAGSLTEGDVALCVGAGLAGAGAFADGPLGGVAGVGAGSASEGVALLAAG